MAPVEGTVNDENNVSELTELEEKIVSQIEYYFGDINIRRDKFMKEKMAENEGWIGIEVLLTFNRLKSLTTDPKVIAESIKKSDSDVVEVSPDESKIKRIHPVSDLTEEQLKDLHLRTVHLKGFPTDATLDAIKAFASQYGKVEAVEMRKTRLEKTFKGCCMVVYSTLSEAEKAIEGKEIFTDAIPKFLRENKIDYFKRKAEYRRERMANRKKARFGGQNKKDGDVTKVEVGVDTPDKNKTEGIKDEKEVTSGADCDVKAKGDSAESKGENGTTKELDGAEDKKKEDGTGESGENSRKRKFEGHRGGHRGGRGKRFKKGRRGGYKGGRNRGKSSN